MQSLAVSEAQVRAVKAPPNTETWFPFPHAALLDEMEWARQLSDIEIVSNHYELSKDGRKFFGRWDFEVGNGIRQTVGFRNSIDKSMSVGLVAGTFVVVCSNMAFSGEWLHFRKHTARVMEDLRTFVLRAFDTCLVKGQQEVKWQEDLDNYDLHPARWKCLTYDAIERGIVAPSRAIELFNPLLDRNLSVWFNTVTNILSQRSLLYSEQQFTNLKRLTLEYIH